MGLEHEGRTPLSSAGALAIWVVKTLNISPLPELQVHLWTLGDLLSLF